MPPYIFVSGCREPRRAVRCWFCNSSRRYFFDHSRWPFQIWTVLQGDIVTKNIEVS